METDCDDRLASLGVHRLLLPLPFENAGGPINALLIENRDGTLTLFDTGLGTPGAVRALEGRLASLGRRIEEISTVIVSHGHADHYGAARAIVERSGAQVFIHSADRYKVLTTTDWDRMNARFAERFRTYGVPEPEIEEVRQSVIAAESLAGKLEPEWVSSMEEGHRFSFRCFEAEVLHTPGHTSGLVCLHVPDERLLFADDLILEMVTPNPLMEMGPPGGENPRSLIAYHASVARVRALAPFDWVLPGHGEPIRDGRATIDSLCGAHARRQDRIVKHLLREPITAYDLIPGVFGRHREGETFFTLSEVVGNLEVLEEAGWIERHWDDAGGRYLYALA